MSRKKEQLKNVFRGHSKILLWDLINKESLTLEEAIVALKYLLYDDKDLKSTKWKAKRVDEAVTELAVIGLLHGIKDLKKKWTNEDGTPVTLEDYRGWPTIENHSDYPRNPEYVKEVEELDYINGSILPSKHFK